MQSTRRAESTDSESNPPRTPNRAKHLVAGIAVASATALAITPALAAPTLPDVQIDRIEQARMDAYGLTAAWNPLDAWQNAFNNSSEQLDALGTLVSATFEKLSATLSDPDVQDRLTSFVRNNVSDPTRIPTALAAAPEKYGDRISNALSSSSDTSMAAISGLFSDRQARDEVSGALLWEDADGNPTRTNTGTPYMKPGVFPLLFKTLTEGSSVWVDPDTGVRVPAGTAGAIERDVRFVDAFGDVNMWFLMDVMGDNRADFLDVVRLPGDFLEDMGAETLARILGTSWMDQYTINAAGEIVPNTNVRPGWSDFGLLARGRLGNLARALMAPQITAIFRTMEVLDDVNNALQKQDVEKALTTLVDAPAEITNAFFNGYKSPVIHPGANDAPFPGLFSARSTLNFFFNEVPNDIANVLKMKNPNDPVVTGQQGQQQRAVANTLITLSTDDAETTTQVEEETVDKARKALADGAAAEDIAPKVGTVEAKGSGAAPEAPVVTEVAAETTAADTSAGTPEAGATDDAASVAKPERKWRNGFRSGQQADAGSESTPVKNRFRGNRGGQQAASGEAADSTTVSERRTRGGNSERSARPAAVGADSTGATAATADRPESRGGGWGSNRGNRGGNSGASANVGGGTDAGAGTTRADRGDRSDRGSRGDRSSRGGNSGSS